MKPGKVMGIVAIIFLLIAEIFCVITVKTEPMYPAEIMELLDKDEEEYYKKTEEIDRNAPGYLLSQNCFSVFLALGLLTSIASLIMMISQKEEGKYIPLIAFVLVIIALGSRIFLSESIMNDFKNVTEYSYNNNH